MAQPSREDTTWMFDTEQARRMLPDGASDTRRAIGTRCKRAGAQYVTGWPVKEIEQVRNGQTVTPITPGTEPFEVYTFDQVITRVADLGWWMTDGMIRYRLQQAGALSRRGYSPPDKVREAMQRPAGRNWRRSIPGDLTGRSFLPQRNDSEAQ